MVTNIYACLSYVPFASNPLELEVYPPTFLLWPTTMPCYIVKVQWIVILNLHLFHVDNSTRKMQVMVDWYKDTSHIEYVLPSSTPWCCCVTFGVICVVKCYKTNLVEQGWISSVYFPAHYFILFLQIIHVIIAIFCLQHSKLETM